MVIDKDAVTDNAATNRLDAATDHLDLSVSARKLVSVSPWELSEAEHERSLIEADTAKCRRF
jgi:hypothetical protein